MIVKATREGLIGGRTSTGYVVEASIPFVALPSTRALHRVVKVTNPLTSKSIVAIVLDVGPWNVHDDTYVFSGERPQAETGVDSFGRPTNKAGIDLGEKVWNELGMVDNTEVEWMFV
jgi:hypothetical protein